MPPKAKAKSKTKTDGKEILVDWSKYPSHITEINNPNFYFGVDKFKFKNGDSYEGEYCAHRCGIVWREGKGIYKTKDGHLYEGKWENDQFLNSPETTIKYPDGTIYEGQVQHGRYSGLGTYVPRKNIYISSNFEMSRPTGNVELLDANGNYWSGQVADKEEVLLLPYNHFYTNLSYEKGLGEEVDDIIDNNSKSTVKSVEIIDPLLLKSLVFKKSTKTLNDFKHTLEDDKSKIDEDDKLLIAAKTPELKAKFGSNKTLLELYWSKEYRNSCLPVQMIYPTVDVETKETNLETM